MVEIELGIHLDFEAGAGIVGNPHVLFLKYDRKLRADFLLAQGQPGHPVGLEFHERLEVLARGALKVARIVGTRERVLLAANGGDSLREQAHGILLGTLEHEVFEEMREAGLSRRLVGRAHLVPDHMGHDRRAVVRNDDDFQAVFQREMADLRSGRCFDRGRHRSRAGNDEKQSEKNAWQRVGHDRPHGVAAAVSMAMLLFVIDARSAPWNMDGGADSGPFHH